MYGSQNEGWGVVIKFDSQLATSQVKGEYQIKYTLKKKGEEKVKPVSQGNKKKKTKTTMMANKKASPDELATIKNKSLLISDSPFQE